MRGGTRRRIDARELVPGDLMLLSEGDRVAADARTLAVMALTAGNLGLVAYNMTTGNGWRALAEPGALAFRAVSAALATAVLVPAARTLLHFSQPAGSEVALAVLGVAVAVLLGTAVCRRLVTLECPC
mgnify:FL=1